MKDRYIVGFIAGVIGGIASSIINYPLYLLNFTKLRLLDYAVQFILGKVPKGVVEVIFGEFIHWGFSGAVGILFAYLVLHGFISNKHLWFKGWGFGLGFWFLINILTTIYKIQKIAVVPVQTAIINAIASSVFGIIMALVFDWLIKREKAGFQ